MSVKVVERSPQAGVRRAVSGAVVKAVLARVRARGGDAAVSQVLALAGERRTFADLADPGAWSSLDEAVALFDAAALVTADGAVGLHAGQALLPVPGDGFVSGVLAAGSTSAALEKVGPLLRHFDGTSEAVPLEVASDHAVVQVTPIGASQRHAHLCELTRGLLSQIPVVFGSGPALITESECSARGGRRCVYAMSWEDPSNGPGPVSGSSVRAATDPPDADVDGGLDRGTGFGAGPAVDRSGFELDGMRTLIEGAFATAPRGPPRRCRGIAVRDRGPGRLVGDRPPLPVDGPGPVGDAGQAPPAGSPRGRGPGPGGRALVRAPRRRRGHPPGGRHRLGAPPLWPPGGVAAGRVPRATRRGAATPSLRRSRGDRPRRLRRPRRRPPERRHRPDAAVLRREPVPGHHAGRPGPTAGRHRPRRGRVRALDGVPVGGRFGPADPPGQERGQTACRRLPGAHRPAARPQPERPRAGGPGGGSVRGERRERRSLGRGVRPLARRLRTSAPQGADRPAPGGPAHQPARGRGHRRIM